MTIHLSRLILNMLLLSSFLCQAQTTTPDSLHNKAGIGGWYFRGKYINILGNSSLLTKRENEVCFSLTYATDFKNSHEIIFGTGYYYSVFKKKCFFDLFLIGEVDFNYHWYHLSDTHNTHPRYGPFISLGLKPEINFTKRFSLSYEVKAGFGYNWSKAYEFSKNNYTYHVSEAGFKGLLIYGLKFNYKF